MISRVNIGAFGKQILRLPPACVMEGWRVLDKVQNLRIDQNRLAISFTLSKEVFRFPAFSSNTTVTLSHTEALVALR